MIEHSPLIRVFTVMQTRGNNAYSAARAVAEKLLSYPKEKDVSTLFTGLWRV